MDNDEGWNVSERKGVICTPRAILDSVGKAFDVRDMIASTTSIKIWEIRAERFKLVVREQGGDAEATVLAQPKHCIQAIGKGFGTAILAQCGYKCGSHFVGGFALGP